MPQLDPPTLLDRLHAAGTGATFHLHGPGIRVPLAQLAGFSALDADPGGLRSRCVLLLTQSPLEAAVGVVELDGLARRFVLCPPGVAPEHLPAIAATAEVDAVVGDLDALPEGLAHLPRWRIHAAELSRSRPQRPAATATEWILLTSGTSGVPKLVVHTLETLCGAIARAGPLAGPLVWSTFYDIRRYGGLQILLRALVGGGSLVLSDPQEAIDGFLRRAAALGVTHITGTPTHWRRALMDPVVHACRPQYVRMSGEIADQAIIDRLQASFPQARVAHAYASTEAGVGFEVDDGREGFPSALVGRDEGAVALRVQDDTLRIRSARTALRYLGADAPALRDADGFVDTGDVVQLRGDRYYFAGRRGGIINVGGLKVHPEEIEAVINRHPGVRMSLVKARRNPITGSIVVAEVVPGGAPCPEAQLKAEILDICRASLAPYKVPAMIRVVSGIEITPSGKITRVEA
jgi:acyl-CoA synthetase (AMP-forming)/AMP-acid ligase II